MDAPALRNVARALAAGRVALGAAILLAPATLTRHWLGADAHRPVAEDLARGLAVRDVALGVAVLQTLADPVVGPRLQAAAACADSVDALATLAARRHLPAAGAWGTVAVAGAAGLAGFYVAHRLAHA